MLNNIIEHKKKEWLQSNDCPVKDLVFYMKEKGNLRDTQIEAIETYLFLKIEGQNKPLWTLFSEGFFTNGTDLSKLNINQKARDFLSNNKAAHALYDFSRQKNVDSTLLPELEKLIVDKPSELDYEQIIKNIFYNVDYADYLMSLPMGAGKTYLMAAFIYIDLYFAHNEPENKIFAHNFLVLIPSGLKSSIVPSLRTIENFDPTWVIPDPAASELKRMLKFEILDESRSTKKSNRVVNPNAGKVNACLPNPFGRLFVVNAEKVILDRLEVTNQLEVFERTEDEKDKRANELRNLIGKIPNLSILIDEVHHAATDEIKLRQVVNKWQAKGNITTVLGFSGTPYLAKADKIQVNEETFFKFSQITNTVYYYPLVTAIKSFLKTPKVKIGQNLDRFQIIRKGIRDFQATYGNKKYENGTIAKIAIYCTNIEVLEAEVYPFLTGELKINPAEILKFHKGNKEYSQPEGSELEFRSLDLPISKKQYILLVQVGKEGWDCPSLTSVILSQKGDSPKNMVLQTSCRCLRQVDPDQDETALIWLNDYNAKTLNDQLKKEQQTSIEEINKIKKDGKIEWVERFSRMELLDLPLVDFYQLRVKYQSIEEEKEAHTKTKLQELVKNIDQYKAAALVTTAEISNLDEGDIAIMKQTGFDAANFNLWVHEISKESYGLIKTTELYTYDTELQSIFKKVTYEENDVLFWNELYDLYTINSKIRLAFSIKRDLKTESEVIPENANLLLVDKLGAVEKNDKLYPEKADVDKILAVDESCEDIEIDLTKARADYDKALKTLEDAGMGHMMSSWEDFQKKYDHSLAVRSKDKTLHYLPYNFVQSGFEKDILQKTLQLDSFKENSLEVYYNGERGLTEFVINCFAKNGNNWKNIGRYTTDFLIIQRKDKTIHKALLVETKGEGYKNDPAFLQKKNFVEIEFLKQNNDKFGYQRFDFLYLEDGTDIANNIVTINNKIDEFFKE
ncbi:DEAD/DEAH box helicase family protein [Bizionia paragorgiae]|uniref:DEAD/DEAH box helicase family protein n=1 Tax=Bizionia paragorgiae TaxID=283786 RepID=UPI003A93B2C7